MDLIDTFNIDLALMGTSGFSVESGFTVANVYEGNLKRKVVEQARKVIVLMDSSKINKNMAFTYAGLKDIDVIVSEKPLPEDVENEVKKFNIEICCS